MSVNRRTFLRVVGGVGLSAAAPWSYAAGADKASPAPAGVLVEAASFAQQGGWKLDTQHVQQMGGCYLLAHGLGKPVANARTTVRFPRAGQWRVWVRTRDWCPGDWRAPGRFRVLVNNKALDVEFGVDGERWHWQAGGTVEIPAAGDVALELKDLTGFDGRCDAIYFSQEARPTLPNENLVELAAWKDRLSGRAGEQVQVQSFGVVIVGGGISGCAAAIAARRQGLSVALIQDRSLFGGNASQEVRVHTIGIHGKGGEILKTIDTPHYPNGSAEAIKAQAKREATMAASGVSLLAGHVAIGLEKVGDRIASVDAREVTTGIIRRFRSSVFIDATGDGWLGYWSGADHRYGREASSEFGEAWDKHGDLWSPRIADNRVMGSSLLWNSQRDPAASTFPETPWAMDVARGGPATNGDWNWEYSANDLNQVGDAEKIRDHLLQAIYGSFAKAKSSPAHAKVSLKWVAYVAGKRESRRLMGDYIYTMQDMVQRRKFADAVVEEKRAIDSHYQLVEAGPKQPTYRSKALFHPTGGMYFIPFRSLYSRNVTNLMMAGRCFSCSHIGLGGPRIMKTCGQMGIAVGYAASLCKKHGATPREVGRRHIKELRKLIGYEEA